jgi:hypothetical protein
LTFFPLWFILVYPARLVAAFYPEDKENPKCPAEENANCEKSPPISAKKSCGRTDTRTNNAHFKTAGFGIGLICGAVFKREARRTGLCFENGFFFYLCLDSIL